MSGRYDYDAYEGSGLLIPPDINGNGISQKLKLFCDELPYNLGPARIVSHSCFWGNYLHMISSFLGGERVFQDL